MSGDVQCPHCEYTWTPRVVSPMSCPRCHRYFKGFTDWARVIPELALEAETFEEFVDTLLDQERLPDSLVVHVKELVSIYKKSRQRR